MKAATKTRWKDVVRFWFGCAALGLLVVIYRESDGFKRELFWLDWFGLLFIASAFGSVMENLIANGIAKGIAKANAPAPQEESPKPAPKWLERPDPNDHSPWAESRRAFYEAADKK